MTTLAKILPPEVTAKVRNMERDSAGMYLLPKGTERLGRCLDADEPCCILGAVFTAVQPDESTFPAIGLDDRFNALFPALPIPNNLRAIVNAFDNPDTNVPAIDWLDWEFGDDLDGLAADIEDLFGG